MGFKIRRILVAVADASAKKAIARAVDLLGSANAQIELFSVVRPPSLVLGMARVDDAQVTRLLMEGRRQQLEKVAARLSQTSLRVTCNVVANFSVTDAIVHRIRHSKPDMVAIEAHRHSLLERLFLSQSDHDLIRECPVPLLIVKRASAKSDAPILAAIDPWHINDKPRSLDATIVDAARAVSQHLSVPLHSAHAWSPLVGFVSDSMFAPAAIPISVPEEKRHSANIRRQFGAANRKYKIPPRNAHLRLGDPAIVLASLAKSLRAQMLVMGAISRSAMGRIFIGNTAEKVLDSLPCDVLIVKPARTRRSK